MLRRFAVLLLVTFAASTTMAWDAGCAAEYTEEQCAQMQSDGTSGTSGTNGNHGTCPYYMCGNASAKSQSAWVWCEVKRAWIDCPIAYCAYKECVGSNCYPTWIVCSDCSSSQGNNAHQSACPRT